MALDESPLPELLDALRAGDGVNLIRDAVRLVMQELIELEATETIGAGRYERTDARTNERNGHRTRLLSTQAGDIELKIPIPGTLSWLSAQAIDDAPLRIG